MRYRFTSRTDGLRHLNQLYTEAAFRSMLVLERKRTERTERPFHLVRIAVDKINDVTLTDALATKLALTIRKTDIAGWLYGGREIGIIITDSHLEATASITRKIEEQIAAVLPKEWCDKVMVSSVPFPMVGSGAFGPDCDLTALLYDGARGSLVAALPYFFKRLIDIAGSLAGIILFLPFFVLVPILIKCCSKGPVFFTQKRVGRHGRLFPCLKFRTMKQSNDSTIHREFMTQFIRGELPVPASGAGNAEYKMKNDPRVTSIGKFLRKTSLDELPQFINVLLGNMSLVGPRPAIPYEVETYDVWHRRRALEVKPGITGIWQVEGRSRTDFKSMVRMDIRYINTWSPFLDLRLIVTTPLALVSAKGAC